MTDPHPPTETTAAELARTVLAGSEDDHLLDHVRDWLLAADPQTAGTTDAALLGRVQELADSR